MTKIPERIGKYEVIRRLGYGGMGTVFLARDPDLDRPLAIKVLRDLLFDEQLIQRFLREARAAGNLRHDNIITVYDAGQHDHQPFMAMEYVDGVSFAEIIRSRQPLALADKLSYLEQVCAGLHYAHGRGIVHRDVKPANLMVDQRHTVRILDFGIARIEGSGITRDGSLIGTLNYMSPEQMLGRPVDHRSDIFGFGAVAYELIAYERAFPGSVDDGLLHRVPNEPPRPLSEVCPGLPPDLEPIIARALAKTPDERFADLEEMRLALRQIRRQLDPHVDVEPISGSRPVGGIATPTPGQSPSTERREFIERRARQVAYHRDAARNALKANDLDGAAAACEDALTLDPDDREAQQLLTEIEQAREQRGLETKERRERERIVRRHVANADLKLSKGDAAGAAELLRQALTLDPQNQAALALLGRVEQPAPPDARGARTVVRPKSRPGSAAAEAKSNRGLGSAETITRDGTPTPSSSSDASSSSAPSVRSAASVSAGASPTPSAPMSPAQPAAAADSMVPPFSTEDVAAARISSAKPYLAAGALAAAVIVALVIWTRSNDSVPAPTQTIASIDDGRAQPRDPREPGDDTGASGSGAGGAGETRPGSESDRGAAPDSGSGAAPEPQPASGPGGARETARTPDVVPTGRTEPPRPRPAAVPPPQPDPGPREVSDGPTVVVPIDLGPFDRAFASGDVAGALSYLDGLSNQSDERVRAAARRTAQRAMEDMAAAETSASVMNAKELTAMSFASASESKTRAELAFKGGEYSRAARQALAAETGFRAAAEDARRVEDARRAAEAEARRNADALAKEQERERQKTSDFDSAGAWSAMQRFQAAYNSRNVDAIRKVTTTLSPGAANLLRSSLDQCRAASVSFLSPNVVPVPNDPTAALVTVRSTYVCQPKINAPAQESPRDEVFSLRKIRDTWLIERMGSWDTSR